MIPGRLLHRVATSLCSADIRERVIDALIADCQHEWVTAHGRAARLLTLARCWTSFWIALAGCLAHDVRHDLFGFARRVVAPVVCATCLLIVGMSTYSLSVKRAEEAALRENLSRIRIAIDRYYAGKGMYPSSISPLVSEGYLRDFGAAR